MIKLHEYDSLRSSNLRRFLRNFCETHGIDRASLFRYDSKNRLLQGVIGMDETGELENTNHLLFGCAPIRGGSLQNVAQGYDPYVVANAPEEHLKLGAEPAWWGYAAAPVAHDGRIVGVLTMANSITGRPIVETQMPALIEAASRTWAALAVLEVTRPSDLMGNIVEGIDEGLCIIGTGGWIIYANEALAKMYGFRQKDLLKFHVDQLFEALNESGEPIASEPGGSDGPDERWNRKAGGELFPVRFRQRDLQRAGVFRYRLGMAQDLTQAWTLARAERERADAQRKQAELETVLKMTRALQHRVNNPLQVILGSLQLLPLRGPMSDRQSGLAENALAAVGQIVEVMRQMQSLTRVETIDSAAGPMVDTEASSLPAKIT